MRIRLLISNFSERETRPCETYTSYDADQKAIKMDIGQLREHTPVLGVRSVILTHR